MMTIEYYGFEWDSEKNAINQKKHGVSFETAVRAFNDPFLLDEYDSNHSTEYEDRTSSLGMVYGVLILFIIHTERDGRVRIISARKATKNERIAYERHRKSLQAD